MFSRSNAVFAGILALAVVATVVVFAVDTGGSHDTPVTGALSPDIIAAETEFKSIQKEWNENESAFLGAQPQVSVKLTGVQERIHKLAQKATTLKSLNNPEKDALPHLVGAIKAFERVVEPYTLRLINPKLVGPAEWDKMKAATRETNSEWNAWTTATEGLSR